MSLSSRPPAPELPDLPVSEFLSAYLRADLKENNGAQSYHAALRFFESFADEARAQLTPLFEGFMSKDETPTPLTVRIANEDVPTPAMPDLWTRRSKGAWMDSDTPTPTPNYGYVIETNGELGEKVPLGPLEEDGASGVAYGRTLPDDTPAFPLVSIRVHFTPSPVFPLETRAFRPIAFDRGLLLSTLTPPTPEVAPEARILPPVIPKTES